MSTGQSRVAISVVFAVHGAVFSNFATRVPWIAEHVDASPGQLGLALLAPALGAVTTMPVAARLTHRFRSRAAVRVLMMTFCVALVPLALAPNLVTLFASLYVFGAAAGMADVAMNAEGVVVEQRYGRSIMSSLHGLWSVGVLLGSTAGVAAAHADLDARIHFAIAAAVLAVAAWFGGTNLINEPLPGEEAPAFVLPSRRVLLIGLVGFCAIFAEGASNDWGAVYLNRITGTDPGTAATAVTAFALAMAGARLVGDYVVRRLGPVATVRASGVLATLGAATVALSRDPVPAIVGFLLIGLGVAVVVPLVFTAAGNVGSNPGQSIAGVATISYGAGMAAPAAIGGIAQVSSLSVSFAVVTLLCLIMTASAGLLRPRPADAPADTVPEVGAAAAR
ncbi:MFS transporter [Luedemannella flava]|uniref:MFS transporter n=1 Tax=Luedemannella flava TaxID=349316 RepID=A0ABP4YM66_9ACTN